MNIRFDHTAGHRQLGKTRWFVPIIAVRLSLLSVVVLLAIVCTAASTRAKDIVVPKDFPTIQAAVDAARPGDTIKVKPGVYQEQITIYKSLTLQGAGEEKTFILAPAVMTPFGVSLRGLPPATIVKITDGATVEMSDFTVSGPTQCGFSASGIAVLKNATLKIKESHVTRIRPEGSCAPENVSGRGIVVGLPSFIVVQGETAGGSVGHATITELVIDKYQYEGIDATAPFSGPPSTATISENLIVGGEEIPAKGGQNGINVDWAIAKVTANTIRGNVCASSGCGPDPINDLQSTGIFPPSFPSSETEIAENEVSANDVGIYEYIGGGVGDVGYVIRENVVRDNRLFGIVIQDGTGRAEENTITGGEVGIAVVADSENTIGILKENKIQRTSVARTKTIQCCGFTATIKSNP